MPQSFPMNGGDATCSYPNNSTMQRDGARGVMDVIKEIVIDNLDIEKLFGFGSDSGFGSGSGFNSSLSLSSARFAIADLGCSVGPNTFYAVHNLIEAVQQKCNRVSDHNIDLEFQVLFNDLIGNDFNTLFASLPRPRNYLAAGVPGSLYGRIFPSASVHIAYSSYTMHWMSKVPEAMQVKGSPAWNVGKIHYLDASDDVVKTYEDQFEEDMKVFLRARAQEIVHGGMIVMLMLGAPNREVEHASSKVYSFVGSILMDMVKEGILEQEKVDSFNIPNFFPCVMDVKKVVKENGCFEIVKLEMVEVKPVKDAEVVIMHFRAIFEGIFSNHFGNEIFDLLFKRLMQQKLKLAQVLEALFSSMGSTSLLLAVLKRN